MTASKVEVLIDAKLLTQLDNLVAGQVFASRSQAIRVAVEEKLSRLQRSCLARECAKLDPAAEQAMAEEGMSGELAQWPEY